MDGPEQTIAAQRETDNSWLDSIPEGGFRYRLGTRPGDAADYFAPTDAHAEIVGQRRHWLLSEPQRYAAVLPDGVGLLEETVELAAAWGTLDLAELEAVQAAADPMPRCLALGMAWEPDFALLRPDSAGKMILVAGCVCFPSFWRLGDKMGRPIDVIHQVVPGLNEKIGSAIDVLLARLKPGGCLKRSNWTLSRTSELNQYPDRGVTRLTADCTLHDIWLRVEHQALVSLPESRGVLFGIRIQNVPIQEVLRNPAAVQRLRSAIETMPDELHAYKQQSLVRDRLLAMFDEDSQSPTESRRRTPR
jgi:hypothetical protein